MDKKWLERFERLLSITEPLIEELGISDDDLCFWRDVSAKVADERVLQTMNLSGRHFPVTLYADPCWR